MNIRPKLEGFEGQDIEIKASMWTGTRMFINGQKAPKGQHRGEMSLTRNDGRVVNARWIPQMFGFDTSQLEVDGKTYVLTPPLKVVRSCAFCPTPCDGFHRRAAWCHHRYCGF